MRKLIEISLGPRSCKAQVATLLPAFGTAIEKKPAGALDHDAMFAKLKQLGGKIAGGKNCVIVSSVHCPHTRSRRD